MDPSRLIAALAAALPVTPLAAQSPTPPAQTSADSYTRYQLEAPGSGAFRIVYDVTATRTGALRFYNAVRAGAEEEVHGVIDLATGHPLAWRLVDGAVAREGGVRGAGDGSRYIEVTLAQPVPVGGGVRLRIDKTYVDTASYRVEPGGDIVFTRSLGIARNSLVLPTGFEVASANIPSQVNVEADGRIRLSFMNAENQALTWTVRARALPDDAARVLAASARDRRPPVTAPAGASTPGYDGSWLRSDRAFGERAFENRDIVYFLEQPASSAFRLYHDYTESRPGVDRYLNVVRPGSTVRDPWAFDLDTGRELPIVTLAGERWEANGACAVLVVPHDGSDILFIRSLPERGDSC